MTGARSEGLKSTALPVTNAADTMPVGIARGKFHGEMTATRPCGENANWFNSPGSRPSRRGAPVRRISRA